MSGFKKIVILGALFGVLMAGPALGHIDLLAPEPILDGRAQNAQALKEPPFGAPGVDVLKAPATTVEAGSVITVRAEVYVYHPGEIVVLYTTDPEGRDVEPFWEIPYEGAKIPHNNLLYKGSVPDPEKTEIFEARVKLPDLVGDLYLVVRQVMHDKFDKLEGGRVSLRRVYYHQAAKLHLVK